jgi:hypothetical protein
MNDNKKKFVQMVKSKEVLKINLNILNFLYFFLLKITIILLNFLIFDFDSRIIYYYICYIFRSFEFY